MKAYPNRAHLLDHPGRRSPECLANLVRCCQPLESDVMQDLDAIDVGVRKQRKSSGENKLLSKKPVGQLFGPKIDLSDEAALLIMCGANA